MFAPATTHVTARPAPAPTASNTPHSLSTPTAEDRIPAWHAGFLQLLPAILRHARISCRRLNAEAREELAQEAVANAMVAYVRLVEFGKSHVAAATPLARFALAQARDGRKVGGKLNVRDVMSVSCRNRNEVVVEQLDCWDAATECWQEVLVEDKTCTPAELAASRIDFIAWLASLSVRGREIAKMLANGGGTLEVASKFKLSPARVSQLRRELWESWVEFHEPRGEESQLTVA
jgi:hypothetical protein